MDYAAESGHLDIVRFLHQNRNEGCTTYAMDYAAKNGHRDVVNFFHENFLMKPKMSTMLTIYNITWRIRCSVVKIVVKELKYLKKRINIEVHLVFLELLNAFTTGNNRRNNMLSAS